MRDRSVVETFIWQHTALTRDIFITPAGFEPVILAVELQQIDALDVSATRIDASDAWSWILRAVRLVGLEVSLSISGLKGLRTTKSFSIK
jgi:hypothetical protein